MLQFIAAGLGITLAALIVQRRRTLLTTEIPRTGEPFDPFWYRNPDYKALGGVSNQWLEEQKRNA